MRRRGLHSHMPCVIRQCVIMQCVTRQCVIRQCVTAGQSLVRAARAAGRAVLASAACPTDAQGVSMAPPATAQQAQTPQQVQDVSDHPDSKRRSRQGKSGCVAVRHTCPRRGWCGSARHRSCDVKRKLALPRLLRCVQAFHACDTRHDCAGSARTGARTYSTARLCVHARARVACVDVRSTCLACPSLAPARVARGTHVCVRHCPRPCDCV